VPLLPSGGQFCESAVSVSPLGLEWSLSIVRDETKLAAAEALWKACNEDDRHGHRNLRYSNRNKRNTPLKRIERKQHALCKCGISNSCSHIMCELEVAGVQR
jgi:hypothetical protein